MAWWRLAPVGTRGREVIFTSTRCPLVFSLCQKQHWLHIQISYAQVSDAAESEWARRASFLAKLALVFTVGFNGAPDLEDTWPYCVSSCKRRKTRETINNQIFTAITGWSVRPPTQSLLFGVMRTPQEGPLWGWFLKTRVCLPHTLLPGNGNCQTG